ncbi:MAG: hypothetical protein K2X62_14100 [Beijerinckiaceae bacterium]|nr:hypothetical protein [Beijerinckiaceae bacterium]MDO9442716.1 hypothetical protein [Beijerinckiaceae bacterium]
MTAEIEFRGQFRATALGALQPANWYMGFRCQACHETFAVLDDLTGAGEIEPMGTGTFDVVCPACSAPNRFQAGDMIVFQAATARAGQDVQSGT